MPNSLFSFESINALSGHRVSLDLSKPVHIKDGWEVPQLVNPDFNGEIVWFSKSYGFFTTDYQGRAEVKIGNSHPVHIQIINGVYHD